ncbi:MAG: hypothetical protein AB7L71_00055 [Vicinamibacterales bacterium]
MKQVHVKSGDLREVFGKEPRDLHAHLLRLCVLFEDLRVEFRGFGVEPIPELDELSITLRRQYFIRRSIATLLEFAECFRKINESPDFASLLRPVMERHPEGVATWEGCVAFFNENEATIRKVRNDLGGHFGEQAARAVIQELVSEPDQVIGDVGITQDEESGNYGPLFHCATIFTDLAMARHRPAGMERKDFINGLGKIANEAYRFAGRATNVAVGLYIVPQIG